MQSPFQGRAIDFDGGGGAKIECKLIQTTEIILNMLKGFQKSCSVSELESKLYRLQQKKTLYITKYIQESKQNEKYSQMETLCNMLNYTLVGLVTREIF